MVRVNPSAQAGSRSVLVYLRLDRSTGFRQGLFAQGTIDVGRTETLALPLTAVRTDKPAPYVQMVIDGRIAHRPVETGLRGQVDGQTMVAVRGIEEGAGGGRQPRAAAPGHGRAPDAGAAAARPRRRRCGRSAP